MQNAAEYFDKTRSAAAKLFEGIDTYLALLRQHSTTFVTSYTNQEDFQRQYEAWYETNRSSIQAALEAQKQYLGESFAQATLCGSVLQLAAKAIECYSKNTEIPEDWKSVIKPEAKPVPFCTGRLVRGVPLGLVIYAGRNQHIHFEDQNLREPNVEVFRRLAINHGYGKGTTEPVVDPAFHLGTESINSFANNITALIEWRSVEAYENDMRKLLEI
jgi:hypothetical protein